jgi:hypothetical protein
MKTSLDAWRRAQALEELYGAESFPERLAANELWWLCPFLLASADEGLERHCERAVRAGYLWLRNPDLRLHRQLIIAHAEAPWSLIFQRAELPEEDETVLGPFERTLLNEHHKVIPGTRFRYQESMAVVGRKLRRQ